MITGNVKIKITGRQTAGEESDITELYAEGFCETAEEGYVIRYIEKPAEDMEVENVITFSKEKAVMAKKGIVESEMIFVPGEKYELVYKTPFGAIDMAVQCESIFLQEDEKDNSLTISYSLYSGGQLVAYCKTLVELWADT